MPEITKTQDSRLKTQDRIIWLLFALVVIFVYFFGLNIPLLGPDEPRYSQVAREMFERGDFVTPTLGGYDWFEKPALLYWLQIVSYHLFGVSEFAARFGSAIFGLGTILSLWILGRSLATENTEKHREIQINRQISSFSVNSVAKADFANWLAIIAASSIGLIAFSRGASFDIILTFPITASLVGFFIWEISHREHGEIQRKDKKISKISVSSVALFSFYLFIGVALIAKGLVGIIFPFAIVAFYHVLSWKLPNKTFIFSLLWGTILSLIVASVWYLPMYQANGWKFVDEFFIQHHFQRYASNKYFHPQPFWFFFLVLPLMTIPWLPFFLAAIWDFVRGIFYHKDTETQSENDNKSRHRFFFLPFSSSPLLLFCFSWLAVPLVFFSFSGSKLPGYILPALPAALILTADYVYRFVQKSAKRKYALCILAFLTFAVVVVLLHFVVPDFAFRDSVKGLMEIAHQRGYTTERVLNLHTISHNSEFYAAKRLIRAEDGKLKKFLGVGEIVEEIKRENGSPVLVVVPLEYLKELTESNLVESEVLADNTELAIVLVKNKEAKK
jgi:4-amino-4-deoxy-L-arabinose transferase-like glycosyltransferase